MIRLTGLLMATCVGIAMAAPSTSLADGAVAAQPAASQPAFIGPICVAILEPEILADLPIEQRKVLAGAIDTLLTKSLSGRNEFVLVDRQLLDKVLDEHKAVSAGAATITTDDVAELLRPFWSAGVLICSQLDATSGTIIIEAVSAQTGQLLGELYLRSKADSADAVTKLVEPKLQAFVESVARGVARAHDKPLLEISGGVTGGLTRLAWMVDDLADAAGARVAAGDMVIWLVPRQSLLTKEERLLRVMGLGEARRRDMAAGLSPVPHMRLTFELNDSAETGVDFEKTPIMLRLSFQRGQDKPVETRIEGFAGEWDACRNHAVKWVAAQMAELVSTPGHETDTNDDERARRLAEEELGVIAPWSGLDYFQQRNIDARSRGLIARRALRAIHLDPSNEQAAYLVASHVETLYPDDADGLLLRCDRAIAEAQRYLDRFPGTPARRREMFYRIGSLCLAASRSIRGGPEKKDDILRPPVVNAYPYVRLWVRTDAAAFHLVMTDKRYAGNTFSTFGFLLINILIPCIPEERLSEEYDYWREFYATVVNEIVQKQKLRDFLNTRPPPWDLVDAAFQARFKNVKAARAALQRLAREFPESQTILWGGDQHTLPRVPMLLKSAGDPQWETWRPAFNGSTSVTVGLDEMTGFLASLTGGSLPAWDLRKLAVLPAAEVVVPEAVRASGRREGWDVGDVEARFMAGTTLWLVTPAAVTGNDRTLNKLFVAELPEENAGKIALEPVEIAWPQRPGMNQRDPIITATHVTGKGDALTVWIGTKSHGLARFERVNGRWGPQRWYTQADGFPCDSIGQIATCQRGTRTLVMLISSTRSVRVLADGSMEPDSDTFIWTLDPQTDTSSLLLDGSKLDKPLICAPAVVTDQGSSMLAAFAGRHGYELDVRQIKSFQASGVWGHTHDLVRDADGRSRLLRVMWDGTFNRLDELSIDTFKPLSSSPGRSGGRYFILPLGEAERAFGRVWWRGGCDFMSLCGHWPAMSGEFAVGLQDVFWIGFRLGVVSDMSRWVVGYRPSPVGSKDWAADDCWIGPFQVPGNGTIIRMVQIGRASCWERV